VDGWADKWTDRWKPGGNQWKTDGVMDCWPKGIGQSRKSTEFNRKSIKIDGWVMARSGMHMHEKNRNVDEVLMKKRSCWMRSGRWMMALGPYNGKNRPNGQWWVMVTTSGAYVRENQREGKK